MLRCGVREVAALRLEPWRPGSDAASLTTKHLRLSQRLCCAARVCRPCVGTCPGLLRAVPLKGAGLRGCCHRLFCLVYAGPNTAQNVTRNVPFLPMRHL